MKSRTALIEASNTMLVLARGTTDVLRSIITTDRTAVAVLRAIYELRIAHTVPLSGESITISSIATKLGVHPTPLRRVLAYAYTMHIFRAPSPDTVAHTSISLATLDFDPYTGLHLSSTTQVCASSLHFATAMKHWPTPPLSLLDESHRDFWAVLKDDTSEGETDWENSATP
jgi:hypothetical protein